MDEDLKELERRWISGASPEDREAYVRALARAEGRPADWVSLRLGIEGYDAERVRTRLRDLYAQGVPAVEGPDGASLPAREWSETLDPAQVAAIVSRVDEVLVESAGAWFPGLSGDWDPPWCGCHCLPTSSGDIGAQVEVALARVDALHAYYRTLTTLSEAPPRESDPFAEARALGEATLEALISATGCDESWYAEAPEALRFVLRGRGKSELALSALEDLIMDSFESWTRPSPEAHAAALDLYAASVVGAGSRGSL